MQLKIQRSQSQKTGFFGGNKGIFFTLAVRAEYTPQEKADIQKYQIGGSPVYQGDYDKEWNKFLITISTLAAGHSIECPSIRDLQQIESAVIAGCKQLQVYLEVAESFDGREILIDFNKGDVAAAA